jgi:hypothetical protein
MPQRRFRRCPRLGFARLAFLSGMVAVAATAASVGWAAASHAGGRSSHARIRWSFAGDAIVVGIEVVGILLRIVGLEEVLRRRLGGEVRAVVVDGSRTGRRLRQTVIARPTAIASAAATIAWKLGIDRDPITA